MQAGALTGMRGAPRRPWPSRVFLFATLAALTAGACGGDSDAVAGQVPGQGAGGGAGTSAARGSGGFGGRRGAMAGPAAVETMPVELGSIARSVTVSGVVEPIREIGVNSQLAGALLTVEAQEGDLVAEGAVLARVDQRELEAQLAAAEASFQVAEAAYARADQLRERQVITLPEYERERTAFAAARAQLEQLQTRLGYATVRAPIRGMVVEKLVEAGDVVGNQTRLFRVADISTLVVRAAVSELDVVQLRPGDAATLTLDAFPGQLFPGRIRRVFPTADPTTRLVPVEVALERGAERTVKPGFLARATFALSRRDDVLLVPTGAIVGAGGSQSVFVVQDGRAVRRTVETGLTSEGRVEIVSGLDPGEPVVVLGNHGLRDGGEVRVVTGPGAASSAGAGS